MELPKLDERPAEWKWKDITFTFRTNVTKRDRWEIDITGQSIGGDQISINPMKFYETCVRLFVTGWKGVTVNQKDIPYSIDLLMSLPDDDQDDVIMKLGHFIAKTNGIIGDKSVKVEEIKNG